MTTFDRTSQVTVRLMLLYAFFSSAFGVTYVVGREPVWISFALQQVEGLLFLGCALWAPRLSARGRAILLSVSYGLAVVLIVPAAHLAGEDQLHFLVVLPLLVAITGPEHLLPVVVSGVCCLLGSAVLIFVLGHDTGAGYRFGTAIIVVCGATYGVYRVMEIRRRLEETKALQQTLLKQERLAALGEAAALVAHEVRNPLGAIANAVALVRKKDTVDPERLLLMIDEEVSSLDRLVHDLLVLARPMTAQRRLMSMAELLERSAQLAAGERLPEVIRIEGGFAAGVTSGDPELLQLALVNVLRNAVQASPVDHPVRVDVRRGPTEVVISVEDSGPGVPADIRERLFEPFVTTRSSGTGLGLAIAKRVVDAHRGTIAVSAGAEGRGTRFEIVLPQAAA